MAKKRYIERDDASTQKLNIVKKEYLCLSGESSNCSRRFLREV